MITLFSVIAIYISIFFIAIINLSIKESDAKEKVKGLINKFEQLRGDTDKYQESSKYKELLEEIPTIQNEIILPLKPQIYNPYSILRSLYISDKKRVANKELTNELIQIIEKRKDHLNDLDLSDIDLHGAYLSNANLSNTRLNNADLREADLSGANLSGANLSGANLSKTDNTKAVLLNNANVTKANLLNARLNGAKLSNSDLTDADFRGAELSHADLTKANLKNANFTDAIMEEVVLRGSMNWNIDQFKDIKSRFNPDCVDDDFCSKRRKELRNRYLHLN